VIQHRDQLVGPSFSPNGDRIAYFSHLNDGEIHLFTIEPNGSNLTQVTRGKGERNVMPHWSKDGLSLYFYQSQPTQSFRKIRIGAKESSLVVDEWNWETQNHARVDVTQKFMVYTRMQDNRPASTSIRHLESGRETNLDVPLRSPKWSNDGKLIVGAQPGPAGKGRVGEIYICPAGPGPCEMLTKGYNPLWARDDSTIYFLRTGRFSNGAELWRISRKDRKETHLADLRPLYPITHMMDVSPQGEIVYIKFKPGDNELWLADFSAN
jgi:Tol biopolymer transport system component